MVETAAIPKNTWIEVNKDFKSFKESGLFVPGIEVEIDDIGYGINRYLVGHVNENGGFCDDCGLSNKSKVIRYRVVFPVPEFVLW